MQTRRNSQTISTVIYNKYNGNVEIISLEQLPQQSIIFCLIDVRSYLLQRFAKNESPYRERY